MKEDRCETKGREGSEHGQVDKEGPGLQGVHWLQCKDINGDHLWKSLQWSSRSETRWPLVTVTGGEYREVARVDMSPKQHCQPSQPALAVPPMKNIVGIPGPLFFFFPKLLIINIIPPALNHSYSLIELRTAFIS